MFALTATVIFPLALHEPFFLLTAGPLVFGVAHLASTVRYAGRPLGEKGERRTAFVLTAFIFAVAAIRLAVPVDGNAPELATCLALLCTLPWLRLASAGTFARALVLLTPLGIASIQAPADTIGFLILGHNFVGFFFWWHRAKSQGEGRTPLVCLGLFTLAHVLIFNLDVPTRAQTFPGIAGTPNGIVAYAFGQAVHYFVWLRAIPEQHLASSAPVSFARSLKFLRQDFGKVGAIATVVLVGGLTGSWLLTSLERARDIYFALAAFHGYGEIVLMAVVVAAAGQAKSFLPRS